MVLRNSESDSFPTSYTLVVIFSYCMCFVRKEREFETGFEKNSRMLIVVTIVNDQKKEEKKFLNDVCSLYKRVFERLKHSDAFICALGRILEMRKDY